MPRASDTLIHYVEGKGDRFIVHHHFSEFPCDSECFILIFSGTAATADSQAKSVGYQEIAITGTGTDKSSFECTVDYG